MNGLLLLVIIYCSVCINFDIKKDSATESNLISKYYFPLLIGFTKNVTVSEVNLLLDSTSSSSWISTNLCKSHCHTNDTYDIDESDNYRQTNPTLQSINFLNGYVEGYESIDSICVYNNSKEFQVIKGFPFVASNYEENLNGINSQGYLNLKNFTEFLKANYKTLNTIVIIDLKRSKYYNESKAYFFEKPHDGIFNSKKIINMSFKGSNKIDLALIKIYEYKLVPIAKYVIFDISTQFIHIPLSDFMNINKIISSIMKNNCQINGKMYFCIINKNELNLTISKLPDIQIKLNDIWFRISFKNLSHYEIPQDKIIVIFPFIVIPISDHWILGSIFFEQYYAVFDYEKETIGFQKKVEFGGQYFFWQPLVIGIVGIAVTFILILFFIHYCFYPKTEE